jgi:hypothetical protein
MVFLYPKIPKVGVKSYRIAGRTPYAVLIRREIMDAAFGLLNVRYLLAFSLYDGMGVFSAWRFFSKIIRVFSFFRSVYVAFCNICYNILDGRRFFLECLFPGQGKRAVFDQRVLRPLYRKTDRAFTDSVFRI